MHDGSTDGCPGAATSGPRLSTPRERLGRADAVSGFVVHAPPEGSEIVAERALDILVGRLEHLRRRSVLNAVDAYFEDLGLGLGEPLRAQHRCAQRGKNDRHDPSPQESAAIAQA